VTTATRRRTAASSSKAAKPLSATTTTRRPGSQRAVCSRACLAQSVSRLCRLPRLRAYRSDGASTVRKGSAQGRRAHGIGTTSMSESQRSPLAFTKCPCEERTGSR
jgi:hypothetical protein